MKNEYTPGPWMANGPEIRIEEDTTAEPVATAHGVNKHCVLANARLIAAAPELLEALKNVAEGMDNSPMLTDTQESQLESIRRIITKAEGR